MDKEKEQKQNNKHINGAAEELAELFISMVDYKFVKKHQSKKKKYGREK